MKRRHQQLGMSPDSEAQLIDAALQELAEGPLTIDGLVVALRRRGVLSPLEPYDDVEVYEELATVLIDTDDIRMADDGLVGATSAMLDGTSLSDEITAAELERSALEVVPDVTALGFDMDDERAFARSGRLYNEMGHELDSERVLFQQDHLD